MALDITTYSLNLDINNKNCNMNDHLMQGSTDSELLITILKNGVAQTIESNAKITRVIEYGAVDTCNGSTNKGTDVMTPDDSGYDITIDAGKIKIPVSEKFTIASGTNRLTLKIDDANTAYTYSMLYIVDRNPAISPISAPDNLPTYNDLKVQMANLKNESDTNKGNIATNTSKIGTNTGDITNMKKDISDMKAKDGAHDGDIAKAKQDIVKNTNEINSLKLADQQHNTDISKNKQDISDLKSKDTNLQDQINNDVLPDVQQHNLDIQKLQTDSQKNTQDIATKANKDMSNVGEFANGEEGDIFYKKDGQLKPAPINIDDAKKEVNSRYSWVVPPNSIHFGMNSSIHENGGQLEYNTNSLDKNYIILGYENDPITGSKKPVYWEREAKEANVKIQPIDNVAMNGISVINFGNPKFNRQVQKIYFKLINAVTNLKIKLNVNGKDVADYPTGSWDDEDIKGFNIGNNIQSVLLLPFWSSITGYNIKIFLKADNSINMFGDGTLPYMAEDLNRIILKDMATMEDVQAASGKDTAEEIRNKLETLQPGSQLSYNNLDNKPVMKNNFTDLNDTPSTLVGNAGKIVAVNSNSDGLEFVTGGTSSVATFAGLTDTPSSYLGNANKFIKVNAAHTGLEFADMPGGTGANTFLQLTDTPTNYTGMKGKMLAINTAENSIEFVDKPIISDISGLAKKDLTNIDNDVMKTKSVTAGMLQQELEDVSLDKLNEKGIAANLASNKLENVPATDFDAKFRQTQTLRIIYNRLPQFRGLRAKVIEAQQALVPNEFNVVDQIIHIRYQVTAQNQFIKQVLPSASINKALIIEVLYSNDITEGGVKLSPAIGEYFNGATTSYTINREGMAGNAFSEVGGWDWIPYSSMPEGGINVNDQKSNFFLGMESMAFGNGFTATQDPEDKTKVKIDYNSDDGELTFVDTETGNSFTAKKLKSLDKSIRLSQSDADTADIAILGASDNAGIFAKLNEDLLLNSKFSAHSKLHFIEDLETKNSYVYGTNKKGFVIQDVNPQDDPNISGGSQFICIFDLVPSKESDNVISQDGSIVLQLLDSNGDIIQDTQNKELGIQIDYKAGQKFKEEILALVFTVKSYTEVFPNILMNFPNEEVIDLNADTSITLQAFTDDFFKGLAIKAFEDYSGHRIDGYTRYYGYNSINLAQYLSYDVPVQDLQPTNFEYANRLYFSCKTEVRFGIQQGKMVVKDDGVNFPIFSIAKVYDELDCEYIGGKYERISIKLENNNTAFDISLLRYTGTEADPPRPELLSYNGTVPVFTSGWTSVQDFPMNAEVSPGEHTYVEDFLLPDNAKQLAIILYPRTDSIPKELYLVDLEGDFAPWFNRFILTGIISEKENARMYQKEHYLTLVNLPKGISSYRFTADSTDTKVPIGVIMGGDGKIINNNAWADTGAYDPNKVQGDYEFLEEGKIVDFSYIIPCYNEGVAESEVHFWLAKVKADGTFTEIPGSRIDTTIPANRTKSPLMVTCVGELDDENKPTNKFSFNVLKGESVRVFMKSDKTDGFYIECGNDMPFLYKSLMDFYKVTEIDKNVADLMQHVDEITFVDNGVPVSNPEKYSMRIDVKTGQTEIKEV